MPSWKGRPVESVSEVVELLRLTGASDRFASELEHCVLNLEQSRLATQERREAPLPSAPRVSDFEAVGHRGSSSPSMRQDALAP